MEVSADQRAIAAEQLRRTIAAFPTWSPERQEIAVKQVTAKNAGIEAGHIDGLMGPQTRHAIEVWDARQANGGQPDPKVENWRDDENAPKPEPSHEIVPPPVTGSGISLPSKKPVWPRQSGVAAFYGAVGANQVLLTFPFQMRLAWDTGKFVTRTSCHKKCAENFERIWTNTLAHYGREEIKRLRLDLFGGLLNVRKMRGGSAWSMHSWGIAFDVDPEHNQLKWGRDKAALDDKPYDAFWSFVYAEGMIGLGRERNYDWQHFQAALL